MYIILFLQNAQKNPCNYPSICHYTFQSKFDWSRFLLACESRRLLLNPSKKKESASPSSGSMSHDVSISQLITTQPLYSESQHLLVLCVAHLTCAKYWQNKTMDNELRKVCDNYGSVPQALYTSREYCFIYCAGKKRCFSKSVILQALHVFFTLSKKRDL